MCRDIVFLGGVCAPVVKFKVDSTPYDRRTFHLPLVYRGLGDSLFAAETGSCLLFSLLLIFCQIEMCKNLLYSGSAFLTFSKKLFFLEWYGHVAVDFAVSVDGQAA